MTSENNTSKMSEEKENVQYPKSIFCIIATEFCERFSFCGLRTILSLYLRNSLLFAENTSTVIYHVFIMFCYLNPIVGALFADSILGRYRTILYFSLIYFLGNIIMCLAATPTLSFPSAKTTFVGLFLIAVGTGGIKPCVAAFGGDQFFLPAQELQLQRFFSLFYFFINMGGFVGMVVTPILRKGFTCFGDDTCYALGFGFPAFLMLLALVLFTMGKPYYIIKIPKDNIMIKFFGCVTYALVKKCKNKGEHEPDYWLEYAREKYSSNLVRDIQIVLAILYLYIPLPLFWSLFDQQGSRWTFQASRMNGEILGFEILPDQMQVVNPIMVLLMIPFFDRVVYPVIDLYCKSLKCPLRKMIVGGLIAGLAFIASALLEFKLEKTYPILPNKGQCSFYFINTLPCAITVVNPFNGYQYIDEADVHIFHRIPIHNHADFNVVIEAPTYCNNTELNLFLHTTTVRGYERQVSTVFIGINENRELATFVPELVNFNKSLSGKPRLRMVFISSSPHLKNISIAIESNKFKDVYFISNKPKHGISTSSYIELQPGGYNYFVRENTLIKHRGRFYLQLGGVYSLVIREFRNHINFGQLYTMTPPNSIHMFWLLPQYFLISVAEIMFAISGLEFSFTQAPKSMKTITIAAWYLSVALGNLLVILITQAQLFTRQAYEFLLYASLIWITMILFAQMASQYEFVNTVDVKSSYNIPPQESMPLLNF